MNPLSGVLDFLVRMVPGAVLAGLVYLVLYPVRKRRLARAGQNSGTLRESAMLVFFLFCGALAILVLTPRWFHWVSILNEGAGDAAWFQPGSVNWIPFRTFSVEPWSLMILLGNVIMFLPIGFFTCLLWRGSTCGRAIAVGFAATLLIECGQLLVGRSFDVDDLLLNTLGVLLGHLLCRTLCRRNMELVARFRVTSTEMRDKS